MENTKPQEKYINLALFYTFYTKTCALSCEFFSVLSRAFKYVPKVLQGTADYSILSVSLPKFTSRLALNIIKTTSRQIAFFADVCIGFNSTITLRRKNWKNHVLFLNVILTLYFVLHDIQPV